MKRSSISITRRPLLVANMSQFGLNLRNRLLLENLPSSTTMSSLKEAIGDIRCKSVELEPGCMLHFTNHASASVAAKILEDKYDCSGIIHYSNLPSLKFDNLGPDAEAATIKSYLEKNNFDPMHTYDIGGPRLQVIQESADAAVKTASTLSTSSSSPARITHLKQNQYIVEVDNHKNDNIDNDIGNSTIISGNNNSVLVRIHSVEDGTMFKSLGAKFDKVLKQFVEATPEAKSARWVRVSRPCLLVRVRGGKERRDDVNVSENFKKALEANGATQVILEKKAPHTAAGLLFAYFPTHSDAMKAAKNLYADGSLGSHRIRVIEKPQHAVLLKNCPDVDSVNIRQLFTNFGYSTDTQPTRVMYMPEALATLDMEGQEGRSSSSYSNSNSNSNNNNNSSSDNNEELIRSGTAGVVVYDNAKDAATMLQKAQISMRGEASSEMTALDHLHGDIALEIVLHDVDETLDTAALGARLKEMLVAEEYGVSSTTTEVDSNRSAVFTFPTLQQAKDAENFVLNDFSDDGIYASGTTCKGNPKVVPFPTASLEVTNLDVDVSLDEVLAAVKDGDDGGNTLVSSERSGIIRFARRKFVQPGMLELKQVELHGEKLKVKPYNPDANGNSPPTEHTYDKDTADEAFDRFALGQLLTDFLDVDPATRYSVARNAFGRALTDARAMNDLKFLLADNAPANIQIEANKYFKKDVLSEEDMDALFMLFIQRDDMQKFSHDFKELTTLFGEPDTNDAFNWSQFKIETPTDTERLIRQWDREQDALPPGERKSHDGNPDIFDAVLRHQSRYLTEADVAKQQDQDRKDIYAADLKRMKEARGNISESEKLEGNNSMSSTSNGETAGNEELLGDIAVDVTMDEIKMNADSDENLEEINFVSETNEEGDLVVTPKKLDGTVGQSFTIPKFDRWHVDELLNLEVEKDPDDPNTAFAHMDEEKIGKELTEKDTHAWSGIVINADSVQKTTRGGRVNSARVLVAIGNLKGTGGFGIGKSKTMVDALQLAYRDAFRNLVHVDLYNNAGLAHDLYGKHNSCKVYIRATPASRHMVGSDLACGILQRFGISSASVKIVGRRDPYAQVYAIMNALSMHQNIDETARSRGMKYATLAWIMKNGV